MTISVRGQVAIPANVIAACEEIKFESYKVNTPKRFQKHNVKSDELIRELALLTDHEVEELDFVYFSVCKGAEPHTDDLSPKDFTDTTFVIPVILPGGKSSITADGYSMEVRVGEVYEFDHTKTHSMELEDTESGCVVVMIAVKKQPLLV